MLKALPPHRLAMHQNSCAKSYPPNLWKSSKHQQTSRFFAKHRNSIEILLWSLEWSFEWSLESQTLRDYEQSQLQNLRSSAVHISPFWFCYTPGWNPARRSPGKNSHSEFIWAAGDPLPIVWQGGYQVRLNLLGKTMGKPRGKKKLNDGFENHVPINSG